MTFLGWCRKKPTDPPAPDPVDECEVAASDQEPAAVRPSRRPVSASSVGEALEVFGEWSLRHLDDCEVREEIRDHARLMLVAAGRRPAEGEVWAFWWEELVHLVGRRRELAETGVPRVGEQGIDWDQRIGAALTRLGGGASRC